MSFLKDLRFPDPEGLVNRAAFNERFETLNPLIWYWWKRRSVTRIENRTQNNYVYSGDGKYYVRYTSSISIDASGITLINPVRISISRWDLTALDPMKGSYWVIDGSNNNESKLTYDTISFSDQNAVTSTSGTVIYLTPSYHVNLKAVYGDWEYLQSPNRDAYPDIGESGGYEYQFLGTPLDNAVTAPKIATGEYTGTGTYGSGNPNTLTADFEIKLAIITGGGGNYLLAVFIQGLDNGRSFGANTNYSLTGSILMNTLSWYNTSSAENQLNLSGYKYGYILIG